MFDTLLSNKYFVLPATAWIVAQSLKVIWILVTERRLRPRVFVRAGGMPSSHSAVVTALVTTIGRLSGLDSPLFAIAFFVAAIVMYDASGVRRAVGLQAVVLNRMLDEYFIEQKFSEQRLREFIGHTPVQVIVGAVLGIAIGFAGS